MKLILLLLLITSCASNFLLESKEKIDIEIQDIVVNFGEKFTFDLDKDLEAALLNCESEVIQESPVINGKVRFKAPVKIGIIECKVTTTAKSKYIGEDELTILVTNKNTPTIIIDIDHTIADASTLEFLTSNYMEIKQLPNSSKILTLLRKKYQIVYLTARNEVFKEHTMKWLKYNKFPKGPVMFWSLTNHPFFAAEYKTMRISNLKEKVSSIKFAVGDK